MTKISPKQYAHTLFEITRGKSHKEVADIIPRFVEEMHKNGHIKMSAQIIKAFEKVYNAKNNIVQAHVTTAMPLTNIQKEKIEGKIMRLYGAQDADIAYKEDQTIMAGVVIRVGDEIMDSSVRKRLRTLMQQLT